MDREKDVERQCRTTEFLTRLDLASDRLPTRRASVLMRLAPSARMNQKSRPGRQF